MRMRWMQALSYHFKRMPLSLMVYASGLSMVSSIHAVHFAVCIPHYHSLHGTSIPSRSVIPRTNIACRISMYCLLQHFDIHSKASCSLRPCGVLVPCSRPCRQCCWCSAASVAHSATICRKLGRCSIGDMIGNLLFQPQVPHRVP